MTAPDVLLPTSAEEAVSLYGDGEGLTVIAGGTIVLPDITYRRTSPAKAMLLSNAGLAGISNDGSKITLGAMTPVQELVALPAPVGPCAANVADFEIRSQGTVGGNLSTTRALDAPRGDLQGAFLAVGASVRSAVAGAETVSPIEEFLAERGKRLLLEISWEEPAAGGYAALVRPHTHDYTALAVSAARASDGTVRLAVSGVSGGAMRLPAAEAKADDPEAAGEAALAEVSFEDDALASAWYRKRTLPVLVRRALSQLQEAK